MSLGLRLLDQAEEPEDADPAGAMKTNRRIEAVAPNL
jgi:hypothetical protein